ncbi:hypothetical protein GGR50DRAFT_614874 [Xylaria sp. CBS 124048]|nr:hypothetical protein GGR50DRAFT_614874 [Xylaria sp. CBS 124048]
MSMSSARTFHPALSRNVDKIPRRDTGIRKQRCQGPKFAGSLLLLLLLLLLLRRTRATGKELGCHNQTLTRSEAKLIVPSRAFSCLLVAYWTVVQFDGWTSPYLPSYLSETEVAHHSRRHLGVKIALVYDSRSATYQGFAPRTDSELPEGTKSIWSTNAHPSARGSDEQLSHVCRSKTIMNG